MSDPILINPYHKVYQISYEVLGKPQVPSTVHVEGFGDVILDAADIAYAQREAKPNFFVRPARFDPTAYIVVSRMESA